MTKKIELLMLKGLPGSGKSTYARQLVNEMGYVRINKDDLRSMMNDGKFSRANEEEILNARDLIVAQNLQGGSSVVVDDTNFAPVHERDLKDIADKFEAHFRVELIDTPLEECIKRNEKRANKAPLNVITDMYKKYLAPEQKKVEYNDNFEEAIVVDVDGTLAHMCNRDPYDASKAMGDTLDDAVSSIVGMAYSHGYKVIILTGRHDGHLEVTKDWLEDKGVNYDEIYCRNQELDVNDKGQPLADTIVKKRLYETHIKNRFNVKYIIDDRPSVCRMWRELGLKVLQVGDPHVEF